MQYEALRNEMVQICRDSFEQCLKRQGVDVHNYSVMGCTAPKGAQLMTEERLKNGGIAVIEFGGNDSDLDWKAVCEDPEKSAEKLVQVTLPDFRAALRDMVGRARAHGLKPILSTPLPVIADRYLDWISKPLDRAKILSYLGAAEYIYRWQERYAHAVTAVANRTGARLIDLRDAFLAETHVDRLLCADGIHPNERGYRMMSDVARMALAQ